MQFDLRSWIWRHTPQAVIENLRRARKMYRRRHYYTDKLYGSDGGLTGPELESAFREVGLEKGDLVLVHSAMSGLGLVEGGEETLIGALLAVLTPSGTLAMPTFTVRDSMLARAQSGEIFDVRHTPSQTGKLTERFRHYPGAVRSVHPTHSVTAVGDRAGWLVEGHQNCATPFGADSPFARLIEGRGKILCSGVEISYITSYHAFEDMSSDFPEEVYLPDSYSLPVVDAQGRPFDMVTRIHDPQLAVRRIEKRPEVLEQVKNYLAQSSRLKSIDIGKGAVYLIGAYELNEALGELLERGITIYSQKEEN